MRTSALRLFAFAALLVSDTAAAVNVPIVADAWTDTAALDTNHGTDPALRLGPRNARIVLLKFDISALQGKKIVSATLTVHVNSVTHAGSTRARMAEAAWTETSVTARNPAPLGSPILARRDITAADAGKTVTYNVLLAVQRWQSNPAANFGIGILSGSDSDVAAEFSSREGATAPVLDIKVKNVVYVSKTGGDYSNPVDAAENAETGDQWCKRDVEVDVCTVMIGPGVFILPRTIHLSQLPDAFIGSGKHVTWLVAAKGIDGVIWDTALSDLSLISRQDSSMTRAVGPVFCRLERVSVYVGGARTNVAVSEGSIVDSEIVAEGGERTVAVEIGFENGYAKGSKVTARNATLSNKGYVTITETQLEDMEITAVGGANNVGLEALQTPDFATNLQVFGGSITVSASSSAIGILGTIRVLDPVIVGTKVDVVAPDGVGIRLPLGESHSLTLDNVRVSATTTGFDLSSTGALRVGVRNSAIQGGTNGFLFTSTGTGDNVQLDSTVLRGANAVRANSAAEIRIRDGLLDGARASVSPLSCSHMYGPSYTKLSATCQ